MIQLEEVKIMDLGLHALDLELKEGKILHKEYFIIKIKKKKILKIMMKLYLIINVIDILM